MLGEKRVEVQTDVTNPKNRNIKQSTEYSSANSTTVVMLSKIVLVYELDVQNEWEENTHISSYK